MTPILGIWASQISGRLWQPAGAYDNLATVTVPSGGAATITFTGIPQGYKHLQVRTFTKDGAGVLRFNGDTTASNYRYHVLYGTGATAGGFSAANNAYLPADGATGNGWTGEIADVLDYSSTSKNKTIRALGGYDNNGAGSIYLASNLWMSTAAISSITLTAGSAFPQYSSFALYGIK